MHFAPLLYNMRLPRTNHICKTHHQLAADILIAIIGLTFLDAAFPTRWPRRPALNGRLLIPHIWKEPRYGRQYQPLISPYLSGLAHSTMGTARPVKPGVPRPRPLGRPGHDPCGRRGLACGKRYASTRIASKIAPNSSNNTPKPSVRTISRKRLL